MTRSVFHINLARRAGGFVGSLLCVLVQWTAATAAHGAPVSVESARVHESNRQIESGVVRPRANRRAGATSDQGSLQSSFTPPGLEGARRTHFWRFYRDGLQQFEKGQLNRARVSFERASALASRAGFTAETNLANEKLALEAGERLMQLHDYPSAASLFARAVALNPNDQRALRDLTKARYAADYQAGKFALAQGSVSVARQRFLECLAYQPASPEVLDKLARLNRYDLAVSQVKLNFDAASASIKSGHWNRADAAVHRLARAYELAQATEIRSPAPFRSRTLMPAYLSYAYGDWNNAFRLSENARSEQTIALAAQFRRFLRSRERWAELRADGPAILVAYVLTLVLSIYLGLKKAIKIALKPPDLRTSPAKTLP